MVWEAVILGPHALLDFRGKENSLLHGEANGFIVCLESFQASISDVNFDVIIILAAAIWTPYASLQILRSIVRSRSEINTLARKIMTILFNLYLFSIRVSWTMIYIDQMFSGFRLEGSYWMDGSVLLDF
jgi:hypothetical protein